MYSQALGTTALGVGVLTDILTALSLTYFLNKLRTGYHKYIAFPLAWTCSDAGILDRIPSSTVLCDMPLARGLSHGTFAEVVHRNSVHLSTCSAISVTTLVLVSFAYLRPRWRLTISSQYNLMPNNLVFIACFFVLSKCASFHMHACILPFS